MIEIPYIAEMKKHRKSAKLPWKVMVLVFFWGLLMESATWMVIGSALRLVLGSAMGEVNFIYHSDQISQGCV